MEPLSQDWLIQTFQDASIDEVLVNGCHSLHTFSRNRSYGPSPFKSDEDMQRRLQALAYEQGQRLDPLRPAAGGLMSLGDALHLRWHALLPPIARDGPLLSIRRHRLDILSISNFISPEDRKDLLNALASPAPLFLIGPTASGKTSLLIALLKELAFEERVAILEQLPEIPRLSPYWIRVCAQSADISGRGAFDLNAVFDELLRLRPDRLVVGELRGEEAACFRRSLLAGHGAAWCTLHASHPEFLARRLADLSGDSADFWEEIMREKKALVCCMQREKPRLREAWQYQKEGWKTIFYPKGK